MSPGHSEESELGSLVRFPLGFSLGRLTSFIASAGIYERLPSVQHLLADRQRSPGLCLLGDVLGLVGTAPGPVEEADSMHKEG